MTETAQYLIAAASFFGAALIAGWCCHQRMRWPLMVLSSLMAVIALQLYFAFKGDGSFHDLAALRAMRFTVLPALVGTGVGVIAGERFGKGLGWRSWQGVMTGVLLLVGCGAVVGAWLI